MLTTYINVASIGVLGLSIILLEIAFRKDNGKIFIYGLEFLGVAIGILLIKHIPKVSGISMQSYIQGMICVFITYYLLKVVILYTLKKRNELMSLSDIREIVKDEPMKKATQRKNKKVEEGK